MDSSTPQTRIFLLDDHTLVLESFVKLIEPHFEVVGFSTQPNDILGRIQEVHPQIILMDVAMPGKNGFEVTRQIKECFPPLRIIFVTMHLEPTYIMEAFRSGGQGYVAKQTASRELLSAIRHVAENKYYFSPHIPSSVKESIMDFLQGIPGKDLSGELTPRQTEILKLIAQGFSVKDMAEMLNISESTVAFHKAQIIQALGVKSKAELTKYAVMSGLTSLE